MIPKVLTALLAAGLLSMILGALPCEATGAKQQGKAKALPATTQTSPAHDLNSPSMDFSGAVPLVDNPRPAVIPPRKDKNQFFDQTIR